MIETEIKHPDEIQLPDAPEPLGKYVPVSEANGLVFMSGMLPVRKGEMAYTGKVIDKAAGREAARLAAMNALAVLKKHYGTLTRLKRTVQVAVYIAADTDFEDHAFVADGCSEFLGRVFSEGHSRLVFGVNSLPKNAMVELGLIFEIKEKQKGVKL
jgi:enamine deaminase RidA (YjgF/YER057c/UK114 family)